MGGIHRRIGMGRGGRGWFKVTGMGGFVLRGVACILHGDKAVLFFFFGLHYTHCFFVDFRRSVVMVATPHRQGIPESILWRLERQHLFWGCYNTHTEYTIQNTSLSIVFRHLELASQRSSALDRNTISPQGHVHRTRTTIPLQGMQTEMQSRDLPAQS